MPFASAPSLDFGDGTDVGSSTEVGNAKRVGPDVQITGLGALTVATFDGASLKAKVAKAKADVAASPNSGFVLDVQDDPALANDPKTLAYVEATTSPTAAKYDLKDAGVTKSMLPATLDGLELALAALGF